MAIRFLQIATIVLGILLSAFPASAQYFGRNKVQYKPLDFQRMRTEHFDIYFYPEERQGAEIAARLAERWHARLSRVLGHALRGRQPLVLYASHPDFEQTNILSESVGEGTGGVTESMRRRIVLPLAGPLADTDHVIGHELVHAFQFDMTTPSNATRSANGAQTLPLWFVEGMAEYLSIGPVDSNTAMWLRDATAAGKLPSVSDLDDPKYFPYRWGQAFWAYVAGRWGEGVIKDMLTVAGASGDPKVAISRVLGLKTADLSRDWQTAIRETYGPVLEGRTPPAQAGTVVIKAGEFSGDLNVGPAISPDGRLIAFLSERSVFSVDLYVADAHTGKILRRLTQTATDPHYSSLQFISSAGAWEHDSRHLVIATIASGKPALVVFDATNGDKAAEIPIGSLDEIFNPTWAPDGHAICFTGMSGGLTDLYTYDFTSGEVTRLTHDAFADIQPAWSPDGRRIAFATDRFATNLDTLQTSDYRLALIDPQTRTIEEVPMAPGSHSTNPQWSPDGASLLFVSDRDGVPDVYRLTLSDGQLSRVTRLTTGVSGITSSSPAIAVASTTGTTAFTVYGSGKYDIHTVELSDQLSRPEPSTSSAAELPPRERKPSDMAALVADPAFGLPAPGAFSVASYRPGLAVEQIGQISIAAGANQFGPAFGGGVSFLLGDLLGNHRVAISTEIGTAFGGFSMSNSVITAAYVNQKHRWNWGILGGQTPYLSGGYLTGVGTLDGQPVEVQQTIIFRQTEQSLSGLAAYPFNRSRRVELTAGVSHLSFTEIVNTSAVSLLTGRVVTDSTQETSVGQSLTLGTSAAALVHDTTNFGATSPVQGQRYRFEAAPTFGGLNYTSALVDFRRYFMPLPFYTLAGRIVHYGRYGSDAEDPRLFPLSIAYPTMVRGYDIYAIDSSACVPEAGNPSACPIVDRLIGSRLLVGNLEFRFPLLRPFGVSSRMYGPLPMEIAVFADGGVTWNGLQQPSAVMNATGAPMPPRSFRASNGVASTGIALRINLGGVAIGEFDFVRPLQLPGKGWVFQANLMPGF